MPDLLERTDEKVDTTSNDGDHDRFQHYFEKSAIEKNFFDGLPMTAICGKVVKQQVDPKGRPICDDCQYLYDNVVIDA